MAEIAAPGQPFEVVIAERAGVSQRVFKNSPTTRSPIL